VGETDCGSFPICFRNFGQRREKRLFRSCLRRNVKACSITSNGFESNNIYIIGTVDKARLESGVEGLENGSIVQVSLKKGL
jgi:hypothetical protein